HAPKPLVDGRGCGPRGEPHLRLDHGLVVAGAAERRIDARRDNIVVHGPTAADDKTSNRSAGKEGMERSFSGGFFAAARRDRLNFTRTHPLAPRTVPPFFLSMPQPVWVPVQHLAEARSVIKATFS